MGGRATRNILDEEGRSYSFQLTQAPWGELLSASTAQKQGVLELAARAAARDSWRLYDHFVMAITSAEAVVRHAVLTTPGIPPAQPEGDWS